ncbi:MAG: hypothetical protein QOC79_260 [Actinomycetota bacterium]|nr:hypothetical protein [Actinomycetota bacterium]
MRLTHVPMKRILFAGALAVVAIAAVVAALLRDSDAPAQRATDFNSPPYTRGIEVGHTYEYSLGTHCGIHQTRIDGTNWRASPPLDDGNGNPPDGWSSGHIGTLQIVSENTAVYTLGNGLTATFIRDNLPGIACA